jgi:cytochrome c biogenesis protein CcmG, thiol:disulfide interchange protein DsbE
LIQFAASPFHRGPFAPYYKVVLPRRLASFAAVFILAILSGCDRGARPYQMDKPAPDFTVSDGTSTIHLANYRGQIVLLNFWATWCAPCIEEMPALIQLHHDRPDLAILAVSIDEDEDSYKRFLVRRHVDLITVRDPEQSAAKLYHTDGWPETYIIDRKGLIRRKVVGDPDWSNPEIRAFLKSL